MLAVLLLLFITTAAPPVTTLTISTSTSTSSPSHLLPARVQEGGGNHSLDVPQGDQPPVPPIKEGPPFRPFHWQWSTNRTVYIKNRYGKFLEMWPNGSTQGVSDSSSFCMFVVLSHLTHVVMRGFVSDRYLCMNTTTRKLYSRTDVHKDCFVEENMRNGSGHNVYSFVHCQTEEGKRCFMGMFRNGTMRLGSQARQSQSTAQWLLIPVSWDVRKRAEEDKERLQKEPWTPPTLPAPTTTKPVSEREQRRKRVRRWCRNLNVIVRRSDKFVSRCKHDCDILEKMVAQPERYMRRCLVSHVRRRWRKKHRKAGTSEVDVARNNTRIRERVKELWPKRDQIFQRLRQLRRCNTQLRRRKNGRKRSCNKRQLRRQRKMRAKARKQSRASSHTPSRSRPQSSRSRPDSSRSKSRSESSRKGRRVRHQRKRTGSKRRGRRRDSARSRSERNRERSKSRRDKNLEQSKRDKNLEQSKRDKNLEQSKRDRDLEQSKRDRDLARPDSDRGVSPGHSDTLVERSKRSVLWTVLTPR